MARKATILGITAAVLAAALLVLNGGHSRAAESISFDAASACTPGNSASFTWSHTVGSGNDQLLVVGLSLAPRQNQKVEAVTYAGGQLTRAIFKNNSSDSRAELWYMAGPVPGTNDVVVTMSSAAAVETVCGSTSWSGVDQTAPFRSLFSDKGTSNQASTSLIADDGDVVHDVLAVSGGTGATAAAGQTERWNAEVGTVVRGAGSDKSGSGTVTTSWDLASVANWSLVAVALKPPSAATDTPTATPADTGTPGPTDTPVATDTPTPDPTDTPTPDPTGTPTPDPTDTPTPEPTDTPTPEPTDTPTPDPTDTPTPEPTDTPTPEPTDTPGATPTPSPTVDPLDIDGDGVPNNVELVCASDPDSATSVPERTDTAADDDGDGQFNEGLPSTAVSQDCDRDGYVGNREANVGTSDQDPCGVGGWPSDLVPGGFQPNRLNVQDLASFLVPERRFGTSPGHPNFDVRWDLTLGTVIGGTINLTDVAAPVTGQTGYPPMMDGLRAFGKACPFAP